jgi:serine O-acetyltransferase
VPRYWFESRHRYFIKHHGRPYAALCDAGWVSGFLVGEAKRAVLRRPRQTPPGILRSFLRASLDHLTNPRLPGPKLPVETESPLPPAAPADTRPASAVTALELIAEDFVTYDRDPFEPGLWAVVAHRLGRRAAACHALPARLALGAAYKTMFTGIDWVWGIHLPQSVELGRRVRLWHSGCMLLTARSIGDDVHIRHDTTFGPVRGAENDRENLPVIEDRADLGSGVCVLGPVHVGHDAVVGANSLVLKNVAPHAIVLGVPARLVPS